MRLKSRNINYLFIGIIGINLFAWFTNTYLPNSTQFVIMFFGILSITIFYTLLYVLNNVRRAMLLTTGFIGFLILRYLHLNEILYPSLLIASLLSLELTLMKRH
ncbi:hypothetical protein ACFL1P_00825 [Patescibacteria group bacterium]